MTTDRHGRHEEWWVALWSLALGVLLLGPALSGGAVLTYDMVWVPDLALNADVLGLSSGLPRAVPSDAVVAALDELVPGLVLQKVGLLALLVSAGVGAGRLVPGPVAARVAAAGIFEWNAFVVERLLIGHWPVLVGYCLLPWVLLLGRRWRDERRLPPAFLVVLPLASLSASAGLATAVAALAVAWGSGRRRVLAAALAAANAPWVVAGLVHAASATTDPSGATVFALRDEGPVPGPLAALTLGGIWNTEVVPDSRTGVLGWVTLATVLALAGTGLRRWLREQDRRDLRALAVCWGVGWVLACLTWLAPGLVGRLGEAVPGLGLLRDGSRLLGLCAPLLAVAVGYGVAELVHRLRGSRAALAAALVSAALLPVALLPDASWGSGGRLEPASYPSAWREARSALHSADPPGDLLVLPLSAFRRPEWNHDRTVFDPLGRYLGRPYVASDVLVVSGVVVSGEDPRVGAAAEALEAASAQERSRRLLDLGFGAVAVDRSAPGGDDVPRLAGERVAEAGDLTVRVLGADPAERRDTVRSLPAVLALGAAWTAYLLLMVLGIVVKATRRRIH